MTPTEFSTLTADLPYLNRGIFFSELYLFISACQAEGVTAVVESGVRNGLSTRVLHRFWPSAVTSFEYRPSHVPADFAFPVTFGDGVALVPQRLDALRDQIVGVLIDGPKGSRGLKLRDECLARQCVSVVAVHDQPQGQGEDRHSWDPLFRAAVGDELDARIAPETRARYPHHAPGLGVWVS